ncbi:MAG: hypothetical protein FIB03_03675 [Anaerolineae bacterium]|nr:hypothetical protein [Anaerolineae bacterium]
MSVLLPFLALDRSCDQAQAWVNQQLTKDGWRIVRTFDLQVARVGHPGCTCPNHGTDACNCQMVVLLIYPQNGDPATLIIHGQGDKSWLSLTVSENGRTNQRFGAVIQKTLQDLADLLLITDVVYEDDQSNV